MKISTAKKLIPKRIVETYNIRFNRDALRIFKPNPIHIHEWKNIREIEIRKYSITIRAKTMALTLYSETNGTSTTIF